MAHKQHRPALGGLQAGQGLRQGALLFHIHIILGVRYFLRLPTPVVRAPRRALPWPWPTPARGGRPVCWLRIWPALGCLPPAPALERCSKRTSPWGSRAARVSTVRGRSATTLPSLLVV